MSNGNIPVLMAQGRTLPEVWEKALLLCWEQGLAVPTQYDKPGDPPSRDCTMIMVAEEPLAEPRIHRNFPAGLESLEVYRQEVVEGVHDYWIDPQAGKWTYTYHERLFAYGVTENLEDPRSPRPFKVVDQMAAAVEALARAPHTRRAQGITWMPTADPQTEDPPCLQRVWFRLPEDADGNLVLNMNTDWRSRDAYKAAFMNMFALTDLQRLVAEQVSARLNRPVRVGRYADLCSSFHIYGSYFAELEGFLSSCKTRPFETRVWNSDDPIIEAAFEEGRAILAREKETGEIGKY